MTTIRQTKYLVVLLTLLGVPVVMLAVYLTHGAIEPHLPGQGDTWNIQYMLHLVTAAAAALFAFKHRQIIGPAWCWVIVTWNCLFASIAVYATISLWGEMY